MDSMQGSKDKKKRQYIPPRVSRRLSRGVELQKAGRVEDAEKVFREVLRLYPDHPDALHLLGLIAVGAGQLDAAAALIGRASECDPSTPAYHYSLGIVLRQQGRLADALAAFERTLAIEPGLAEVHDHRGGVLKALGRLDEALAACEQALRLEPGLAEAHNNRGGVLKDIGRLDEALAACAEAARIRPDFAEAYFNSGIILTRMARPDEALAAFDATLAARPDIAEAHFSRGVILQEKGRIEEALAAFDDALAINPNYAQAHNNRGGILRARGKYVDALVAFDAAVRLQPDNARAHNNRGVTCKDLGRLDEALAAYREAVRLDPDFTDAHSNLLFSLNYDPSTDEQALFEAHRAWGERYGHPSGVFTTHENPRAVDKTLRVGLVSADLARHPVGFLIEGVLAAADPDRVQFICYSGRVIEDQVTRRLKATAHAWRSSIGLSDAQLAELIRADGIDILIDLSGHTGGNRLPCFSLRPSPVQVTWFGSCHTTGVDAIDYILMDPTYVTEGGERWFTETVVRLPDIRWCYAPPDYAPEVTPPPVLERGAITFGTLSNLTKVTSAVAELWARVLDAAPGSRLLLNWKTLADVEERGRMQALLGAAGIPAERVELTQGADSHAGVLGGYADIDIALDPFPFSGCTTTCELLWMGLPVVTLPMVRPASRQTLGFLSALGRTEWVAGDADEYVCIASGLAADPGTLATMRRQQRDRMAASPICDGPRFMGHLEAALRDMWRRWCAAEGPRQ
jgi:protein O-GlcNAc transferase